MQFTIDCIGTYGGGIQLDRQRMNSTSGHPRDSAVKLAYDWMEIFGGITSVFTDRVAGGGGGGGGIGSLFAIFPPSDWWWRRGALVVADVSSRRRWRRWRRCRVLCGHYHSFQFNGCNDRNIGWLWMRALIQSADEEANKSEKSKNNANYKKLDRHVIAKRSGLVNARVYRGALHIFIVYVEAHGIHNKVIAILIICIQIDALLMVCIPFCRDRQHCIFIPPSRTYAMVSACQHESGRYKKRQEKRMGPNSHLISFKILNHKAKKPNRRYQQGQWHLQPDRQVLSRFHFMEIEFLVKIEQVQCCHLIGAWYELSVFAGLCGLTERQECLLLAGIIT